MFFFRTCFVVILNCISLSNAYAQNISEEKVSYKISNTRIVDIFDDLEKEYGVRFSYSTDQVFQDSIDVDFENEPLGEVLDYLLGARDMEFKIVSNNILIRKTKSFETILGDVYNKSIHLQGKVQSSMSEEALGFASIAIRNSSIGTFTDEEGKFDLEIPFRYMDEKIVISYIGYESMSYVLSEIEGEFQFIKLNENENLIEEVNIVNREKPVRIVNLQNATILDGSAIYNETSGINGANINRTLQLLPGITAHDDNSADIKIRGSNSDGTMIVLDGIPIYNSSHYYGIFSTINTNYIDSVNVFKNAFPIQYSGKTGGIVELFSNQKLVEKTTLDINLNLLTAETKLQVPTTAKSQFFFAGKTTVRRINNDNFNTVKNEDRGKKKIDKFDDKIDNNRSSPGSSFNDLNAKYLFRGKANHVSLNFYRSAELLDNSYETEVTNGNDKQIKIEINESGKWITNGASFLWNHKFNDKLSTVARTYYTRHEQEERNVIDVKDSQHPNSPINNINLSGEEYNELLDFGQDFRLIHQMAKQKIQMGVDLNRCEVDYDFSENQQQVLKEKERVDKASLYGSYENSLSKNLHVNIGLRANFFPQLKALRLSPRILMQYEINDKVKFKGSYSIYQQVIRELYYEYRSVPMEMWVSSVNTDIPILQSTNYMLGSTFLFQGFSLDIEVYQKNIKGASEYASLNPNNPNNIANMSQNYRLFSGDGRVRGIDFIVSSGYKNYNTYLSYTLSKAEERYKAINKNEFYASENDRRHQLKWVNSYVINSWNFGANFIFSSGRLYTNIDNSGRNMDIQTSTFEDRFERLPPYNRIDLSASYSFQIKKQKAALGVSVFNLLNTQNVKYIQTVSTTIEENQIPFNSVVGGESSLLNRTLNLSLKINLSRLRKHK